MKITSLILLIYIVLVLPARGQTLRNHIVSLDGVITVAEQDSAQNSLREGESALFIRRVGNMLWIAIESESIGVVSLCVGGDDEVKILHASAALGAITFFQQGTTWTTSERFSWSLRDTSMSTSAMSKRQEYLNEQGWVATTSSMGHSGHSEFLLSGDRFSISNLHLAVGIMPRSRPDEIIGFPSANAGECASGDLVRGITPETGLSFQPSLWIPVTGR